MARWIARGVLVFPCLNSLSGFLIWDIKVWIDNRSWQPASSVCLADLPSTHTRNPLTFSFLLPPSSSRRSWCPWDYPSVSLSFVQISFPRLSPGRDVRPCDAVPSPVLVPHLFSAKESAPRARRVCRSGVPDRCHVTSVPVDGFLLTLRPLQRSHEVRVLSLSFALSQFSVFNEVYWHNYRSAVLPKRSYKERFQKQP